MIEASQSVKPFNVWCLLISEALQDLKRIVFWSFSKFAAFPKNWSFHSLAQPSIRPFKNWSLSITEARQQFNAWRNWCTSMIEIRLWLKPCMWTFEKFKDSNDWNISRLKTLKKLKFNQLLIPFLYFEGLQKLKVFENTYIFMSNGID